MYDDLVMEHIKNARNYRVLDDAERIAVGTNPLCGDEVRLYLDLKDERIADLAFQCSCCGISMASASILTETVKGAPVEDARQMIVDFVAMLEDPATQPAATTRVEWIAMLDTVRRFPARARCALLPWTTAADALERPGHG
ncbi:MAG: Fe-S cluster assembly sulfur transfer protein SufU [Burkholderiales bacterium]